jgi:hypothetical protein
MHLPGKITYKERGSAKIGFHTRGQSPNLQTFNEPRNRCQGIGSRQSMLPEPEFVNVEGAQKSIPRNRFCQAGNSFLGS